MHSKHSAGTEDGDVLEGNLFEHEQAFDKGNASVGCTHNHDSGVVVDFDGVQVFFGDHGQGEGGLFFVEGVSFTINSLFIVGESF